VRRLARRRVIGGLARLTDHVDETQRDQTHAYQGNGQDNILKNHGNPPNWLTVTLVVVILTCVKLAGR
jgi:hypothetical protein